MDWSTILSGHREVIDHIETHMKGLVDEVARLMVECIRSGGKILICGNGGSAADSQHFAAELVNRFLVDSAAWPALALTTDSSVLTSIANDYSADQMFSKQVEAFGRPGDILIVISTSGNSPNLVKAVEAAKASKAAKPGTVSTIALLGGSGGTIGGMVDHPLTVSCTTHVPRIQEGHLLLIHALCEQIEETLHKD